ncbi:polyhomeotic-like protein 3 isoform X2 [Syngnathoides biaculeatus]|uniref:polyhomeotic-like protein 3 isoform X2 n=1 Tax=Syngnathoides biaculeatus TaxID=300417 RepID=UPI002ADE644E|nr:polyhomeotic-like protein 3 isoform X2 [Syngnathoides biaculeatus]
MWKWTSTGRVAVTRKSPLTATRLQTTLVASAESTGAALRSAPRARQPAVGGDYATWGGGASGRSGPPRDADGASPLKPGTMDLEPDGARQPEHGPASSHPSAGAPAVAPAPPRLTPNPTLLLDSPAAAAPPVTSSPPPPLTPAPSLAVPKMAPARTSFSHVPVPAPPKLSTTASPALRTYARPILPCGAKTSSAENSETLTNGSARTVSAATASTLTPFHTPASPPARQAQQPRPAASSPAGPPRADPVARVAGCGAPRRASLLGGGLKGSGQEQVLLRAQMLILTSAVRAGPSSSSSPVDPASASAQLRSATPGPAGALAGPPLRLKAPPLLCRPQTTLFPPLRPRPRPAAAPSETGNRRPAAPPPPTLYSPVRAVPLRPKLHSAAGSRAPVLAVPPPPASERLRIVALSSALPPPTLSGEEALPLPRSAASPPRRDPATAEESRADDAPAPPNDQRRRDEDDGREEERAPTDASRGGGSAPGSRELGTRAQEVGEDAAGVQMSLTLEDARSRSRVAAEVPLPEAPPVQGSPPELCAHAVGPPELPGETAASRDRGDVIDENASAQSDNQSALSSLSSQSPPSSPSAVPAPPARPLDLSQSRPPAETTENSPWEAKAWPEGGDVLTHVVEGFVIQEGLQPFPPSPPRREVNGDDGKTAAERSPDSREDDAHDDPQKHATRGAQRDRAVLRCQFCGKRGHAHNFMRSKRFCSTSCARGFNVRLTKRLRALSAGGRPERPRPALNRAQSVPGKPLLLRLPRDLWSAGRREKDGEEEDKKEEEDEEDMEAERDDEEEEGPAAGTVSESGSATGTAPTSASKAEPSQWTVDDVTAFIRSLPGCGEVSSAFRLQEIDGQALLLLTEEHLMSSMNIKLGPALKICAHINALKNS